MTRALRSKALGASVAIKAGGIHATHLLDDDKAKAARYEALIALADEAIVALPDEANSITGVRARSVARVGVAMAHG
jgi:hypothetical protein